MFKKNVLIPPRARQKRLEGRIHPAGRSVPIPTLDVAKHIQGLKENFDIFEAIIDNFISHVENLALKKGSFAEKLREVINEEVDEIREMGKCNVVLSYISEQTDYEENI